MTTNEANCSCNHRQHAKARKVRKGVPMPAELRAQLNAWRREDAE